MMNKKHILMIVILFSTIVLFSIQKEKLKLVHGYITITFDKGMPTIPCQLMLNTINESSNAGIELPPSQIFLSGTLLSRVEKDNDIDVGLVFLNPWDENNIIKVAIIDVKSREKILEKEILLPPHHSIARMLSSMLTGSSSKSIDGYFKFESKKGVAVLGMQISPNGNVPIPVFQTTESPYVSVSQTCIFPHFATGAGYRSRLIIWNPFTENINCSIHFFDSKGEPLPVLAGNEVGNQFTFNIDPMDKISIPVLPAK